MSHYGSLVSSFWEGGWAALGGMGFGYSQESVQDGWRLSDLLVGRGLLWREGLQGTGTHGKGDSMT